jgi:hypothetical protein
MKKRERLNQALKVDQELLTSIAKARARVKEAQSMRSDKRAFVLALWKAAAESEYVAFRVASTFGYEDYKPRIDDDPQEDELEVAEQLLNEAEKSILQQPQRSYDSVRKAVTLLRKLYGVEEKGKKQDMAETIDE